MDIHLLCCAHGNECTRTHDVISNTFVVIVWDVGFHMGWKQLHVFSFNMFNSCQWVDIVLTKDNIHTLVNVVIVDPTWTDLLPRPYTTQGFAAFDAT
jgi:hypothetical protein